MVIENLKQNKSGVGKNPSLSRREIHPNLFVHSGLHPHSFVYCLNFV